MYILCFHGTEVACQQRLNANIQSQWERVLTSRQQPLRYCLESVRFEFLRLARHVELLSEDCWRSFPQDIVNMSSISSRSKLGLQSSTDYAEVKGLNPLDSFFPFDPCLLLSVHQYIEKDYRVWDGIRGFELELGPDDDDELSRSILIANIGAAESVCSQISSTLSGEGEMTFSSGTSCGQVFELSSMVEKCTQSSSWTSDKDKAPSEMMNLTDYTESIQHEFGENIGPREEWPLPVRRPRQYSISSTGSW